MVKIRLLRQGRKKIYKYKIVVCDSRVSPKGKYIELAGYYNPQKNKENKFTIKKEIILKWLKIGAKPTETIKNILKKENIWKEFLSDKKIKKNKKRANKKNKITDESYKIKKRRKELQKKAREFLLKKQKAEKEIKN